MSTWQVTNRLTGEGVYAYGADAPDHLNLYPFDTYNHNRAACLQGVDVKLFEYRRQGIA